MTTFQWPTGERRRSRSEIPRIIAGMTELLVLLGQTIGEKRRLRRWEEYGVFHGASWGKRSERSAA